MLNGREGWCEAVRYAPSAIESTISSRNLKRRDFDLHRSMVKWRTRQISSRQIRRGRAHKDRAFVLFTNHGGRQESSDLFALIPISTFYSLRGFFEHLDIERLEARIAQQFISSATMAATSSTPSRR